MRQIAYIRKVPNWPAQKQREAIGSVVAEYGDETPVGAVQSIREGDSLIVAAARVLGDNREAIRHAIEEVHKHGGIVIEASTNRTSRSDGVGMMADAIGDLANEKRAAGVKGGKEAAKIRWREKQSKRMPQREALSIWLDPALSIAQAIKKMPGWKKGSAYRLLGKRNVGAGPLKTRNTERVIRGRVYFAQRSDNGRIKIGFSRNNATKRVASLSSDVDTNIILTIPGTLKSERALHKRFEEYRVRGEWFDPGDELMKFIAAKTAAE